MIRLIIKGLLFLFLVGIFFGIKINFAAEFDANTNIFIEGETMKKRDEFKKEAVSDKLKPNIDLTQENRADLSIILNKLLADEYVLAVRTKNYHWNMYGVLFNDLHKFFDEQYKQLEEFIDSVAERTRALGFRTIGTLEEFLNYTQLKESKNIPEPLQMIKNLLDDHETIIRFLRVSIDKSYDDYGDMGTNNFLTDLIEKHEKMAWMLRSFLEKK